MKIIRINSSDNVAVCLKKAEKGSTFSGSGIDIAAQEDIPAGHKIALCDIAAGDRIIKYGFPIGIAKEDIKKGHWVHTHNVRTGLSGQLEYSYSPTEVKSLSKPSSDKGFMGFRRKDGRVGVRNQIWIIPTVGCVNGIAKTLEREAAKMIGGSVDDVFAFTHPYGCSQLGDDQDNTRKALADLISHPNAGGVLVIGLGCENSGIEIIEPLLGDYDKKRVKFLKAQDHEDEISEGISLLKELIDYAKSFERTQCDTSELIVGLKCGGSDGFSGITANPLVGRFSDLLASVGGTTILTDVPEMFGAETILMDRAKDRETFDRTVKLINDFKSYFETAGMPIYENPSPGNKAGGITTLEDKSLGCTQKSGTSQVCGVLGYGDRAQSRGLNLLSAPGNDLVAATALACAGAQIVLFTTGRGTPFACPVPTMKISSNSALAKKKSGWIDFDAGPVAEGGDPAELGEKLFEKVISTANGEKLKSEVSGYAEIAIFKKGVTL